MKINTISLQLSSYCNLKCKYCFVKEESRNLTNNKFIFIDELYNFILSVNTDNILNIEFCAGEPVFEIELIKKLYKKLKKLERYKDTILKFGLYTNGTNLEYIINLLDEGILNTDKVSISWDGICNTKSRLSDLGDIYFNNKIKLLKDKYYSKDIIIRTALTIDTVYHLYDSVCFLIENNCTNWEYYYIMDNDDYRNPEFINEFKNQIEKILLIKDKFNFFNLNNFKYIENDTKRLICELGKVINITTDGEITPCGFYCSDYNKNIDRYIYGNIFEPFDNSKVLEFVNSYNNIKTCAYKECKNFQCIECPTIVPTRSGDTFEYKSSQVCALRSMEHSLFIK